MASSARSLLSGACAQHAPAAARVSLRSRLTVGRVGAAAPIPMTTRHHMRSFASTSTSTPSSATLSADNAPANSVRPPAASPSSSSAAPSTHRALPLAKISRGRVQLADRRVLRVLGPDAVKYVQVIIIHIHALLFMSTRSVHAISITQDIIMHVSTSPRDISSRHSSCGRVFIYL